MVFIPLVYNSGDQNVLINDWYACLQVLSKQLTVWNAYLSLLGYNLGVVIKPGTERNGTESIGAHVTQVLLNRLYISMISMILPIYLRCSIRNISLFSNYSRNM